MNRLLTGIMINMNKSFTIIITILLYIIDKNNAFNINKISYYKNTNDRYRYSNYNDNNSKNNKKIINKKGILQIDRTDGNREDKNNIGNRAYELVSNVATTLVNPVDSSNSKENDMVVAAALKKMEMDMQLLDNVASRTPQLTRIELAVLFSTVAISAFAPFGLPIKVVELLVPSMAAVSAAVGLSAEYVGKTAVANGKEIAALAIQAAAESEALLASAERIKSILPLCVGISTTASAFALLIPSFLKESKLENYPFVTELYLISPFVAVLAAAIAGLATQESRGLASRAIGVGNRRFASSTAVGKTWLSATEQVAATSLRTNRKWISFATGVLPAPLIAVVFPGSLSFKSTVCAAIAAAQAAYYLSIAEYSLSTAVDAVALKARAAAIADTYANQGSRAGAILPFTTALGGLCAAASAAVVEFLPLINYVELQSALALLFPSGTALLAAAASISKARCVFDSNAASAVAASGLVGGVNEKDPLKELLNLIVLSSTNTFSRIVQRIKKTRYEIKTKFYKLKKFIKQLVRPDRDALATP